MALKPDSETTFHWEEYCQSLREVAPTVDLVLLSHGDLAHCGLYAYAYSRWNLKAPTYTSLPVQAMGRIATTEDIEGIRDEEDVGDGDESPVPEGDDTVMDGTPTPPVNRDKLKGKYVATLMEVQEAFDSVNTLRYSQPTRLQGKCQGLTITPFNAGHTIGGTIWKIRSPSSGTILYAVNVNHMRERHLDGAVLINKSSGGVFEPLARPDLLITDAERSSVINSKQRDRDVALIDTITSTLSSNRSSVLIPCDSSTRLLELLVLLDQHWKFSRLSYPICLLSRTGSEMLTFVRSMMEWLGGTVSKEDVGEEGNNNNNRSRRDRDQRRRGDDDGDEDALGAFALRFKCNFSPNPESLVKRYASSDPKLILAVPATLSHGPSRNLFVHFAAVPNNVVLLTSRGEEGTLARMLFNKWNDSQRADDKWDKGRIGRNVMLEDTLTLVMKSKVPLQGAELEEHLQKERAAKEKEAAHQAQLARSQRMLEADEDESDSDSDSDAEDEDEVRQALEGDAMDTDTGGDGIGKKRKADKALDGADWGLDGDEGLTKQLLSFDIYLKGNVSKATSFFKNVGGQTQRFRMFPYVEKKRRVDEYGETVDVAMWLRKSRVFEEEAETDETKDFKRRKQAEEDAKAIQEPPSKFVTSTVDVQMACRLLFIDMEGLNDGRAVKTIVPQVNPRKMIIVHAPTEAADLLIESCANIRAMTKDIFAPPRGESIQIGHQTNSFSISISDELLATLKMSTFEDNEVGYVTGRVVTHASSTIPTLEPILDAAAPVQSAVPVGTAPPNARVSPDTRLASIGVPAELIGEGVLICGTAAGKMGGSEALEDSVAVRKTASGKVELEGGASPVYYTSRSSIFSTMTAVQIFLSGVDAELLQEQWATRHKYLRPVDAGSRIIALYEEFISFCRNREGRGWATFQNLFQRLGVANPQAATHDLFSRPPNLILARSHDSYGCRARAEHLADYIFVNDTIWGLMENTEDPASSAVTSAYEVVKATIAHELGHTAVSKALGALSSELYGFGISSTTHFSQEDVLELKLIVTQKVNEIATPEKLRLPWKKDKGEAGEWIEFTLFGGIMQLDSHRRAILQTGPQTRYVLTSEQLQHARFAVILHFLDEYPNLSPAKISPSPSSALGSRKKADGHQPIVISGQVALPSQKCPGALFQAPRRSELSPEVTEKLRELLTAKSS
ncbi:Cleavage and polyadenylation specificity factor subunit 2 [Mycena venus]|uniref:Cleavage and polyadenylation specificity factor subunit 2 n=1 Tax=Mycena venus TaxID=2733690 RepID=A0A8H7CW87_9AGAR|nr:Cleavage and polyadenylation specificity factor subunit 2 [Mycena venus]